MSPLDHSPLFVESGRFEPLRQLGSGGFGVVYEVYDAQREQKVALKVLHRADPESIVRFKSEFRSLCEIHHPNLVRLHELFVEAGEWFFTMDLVHGMPMLHELAAGPDTTEETLSRSMTSAPRGVDEARLRALFAALAHGVDALHRHGKLHRDLKPSNALVDNRGHVTLVDFGLVEDIRERGPTRSVVGTPLYMSPEQLQGRPLGRSSDWYSFGVMLYLALTGRRPFSGTEVADKLAVAPIPVRRWNADAPADLAHLAEVLLSTAPEDRPGADDILRALGRQSAPLAAPSAPSSRPFVGRQAEVARVTDAFRATRPQRPVAVHIEGPSGGGKTALVSHALGELQRLFPETVVLRGRCFEHELVPYKAFDALVDALTEWLGSLPVVEQHTYLPRRLDALVSLFPTLGRVPAVRDSPRVLETTAGSARRLIAARALRELVGRIADRRPLVLVVDDVQWSDEDSERLLRELVGDDAPGLLWIFCARDDTWRASGPLVEAEREDRLVFERMELGPLDAASSEALARALLDEEEMEEEADEARAASIARSAEGNPFFIERLARWTGHADAAADLDRVVREQLDQLPARPRRLLEVVAVAGRPLALDAARAAAGLDDEDTAWSSLVEVGLADVSASSSEGRRLSTAHDRIREVALGALADGRERELHGAVAAALLTRASPPADQVARHLIASGAREEGVRWTERAASEAKRSFAFERAIELYELLLAEAPAHESKAAWTRALGEALARAGRGREAAGLFLDVADEVAASDDALALRQQAAEQLLVSGRYDEGIALAARTLGEGGVRVFRSTWGAIGSLAWQQAAMTLRGRSFVEQEAAACDPRDLREIDLCWSMVLGLMMIEPIHAGDFAARHMRLALKAGEPFRVARGYVMDATFSAAIGRGMKASGRVWGEALAAMQKSGDPYLLGLVPLLRSLAAAGETDWPLSLSSSDEAAAVFRDRVPGASTELVWTEIASQKALASMAEYAEKKRRLRQIVRSAEERRDHLSASIHGLDSQPLALLGEDRLDDARRVYEDAIARWTPGGFQVPHYAAQQMAARLLLYEGRGVEAWQSNRRIWSRLTTTLLMRVPFFGLEATHINGTAAVMAAHQLGPGSQRRAALKDAERFARRSLNLGLTSSSAMAHLIWAGVEKVQEQPGAVRYHLETAVRELDRAGLSVPGRMAELALASLLEGDEGEELRVRAEAVLERAGVHHAGRMLSLWIPGFGDAHA